MNKVKYTLSLTIFVLLLAASSFGDIPVSEREALIALYNNTGGNSWYSNNNWKTPPLAPDGFAMPGTEEDWFGVICNPANTHVIKIDLGGNNLSGSLPSQLGNLPNLDELKLYWNNLSGSIPFQLGSLSNLTYLDLGQNGLTGNIPAALGGLTNLNKLHLDSNQLGGSIPTTFENLTLLEGLSLAYNELSGNIPSELGSCINLKYMDLSYNQLTGTIPSTLGNLANLWGMYFYANQLSGNIPTTFGNMTNLEELALANNALTGSIPDQIGNLSYLWSLDLSQNQLTGSIPSNIGNLQILWGLYLYDNLISGAIPIELGNSTNLVELYLGNNSLSGSIPSGLMNLTSLWMLDLNHNQLTGGIPLWLTKLTQLGYLDLSYNQISGNIGKSSGQIKVAAFDLGILDNLWYLDISHNELTGAIPAVLGVLTSLQRFYLNSNMFSGAIPTTLMNLTSLTLADFSYNALYTWDGALRTFLNGVDPGWANTQTIAPTGLSYFYKTGSTIQVSWTPITYNWDSGGYRLFYAATPGGPYTFYNTTSTKSASSIEFNLPEPEDTYYIVIRTRTNSHSENQNTVDSNNSAEISTADRPDINVRVGIRNMADEGTYNLGTRPANIIKNPSFNFTIENLGASLLLLKGTPRVALTGPDTDKFDVTQPPTDSIGTGSATTFVLSASDSWADLPSGSTETVNLGIYIENNDTDETPYNFTIIVTVQY